MANISELLKKIKSARYGRDVRDSIHDAIQAMNTDIENNVPAVQNLTERAESASSSAKTYSTDASAAATNAKNYSDSAKQYSELAASAIARAYDTETTANKHIADTIEAPMLVTKATRNLLNPITASGSGNGITYTKNLDGSYTLNGTATDLFFIVPARFDMTQMTEPVKLVGCPANGSTSTYKLSMIENNVQKNDYDGNGVIIDDENLLKAREVEVRFVVYKGVTVTNLVVKPMLTTDLSATYDDFVPYSGYDIKTRGKNLLNPTLATTTRNGVTCTNNGDGTYTFNGTATAEATFGVQEVANIVEKYANKDLWLVGCPKNGGMDKYRQHLYVSPHEIAFDTGSGAKVHIENVDKIANIAIVIEEGVHADNLIFKPMLTTDLDVTYDNFESYQDGGTVHIDNTTEFPLLGLKSFDGETNIISPGNVEVSHALTDTGKYVMQNMKEISDIKAAIIASGSTTE